MIQFPALADKTPHLYNSCMRLGVIGTSGIARQFIDAACTAGFTLTAVCSRDAARAEAVCRLFGSGAAVNSADKMMPHVDVVYIAVPPALHYEYALKALAAKKHVLVEKPCFCTVNQLEHILNEAAAQDLIVLETMRLFYSPLTQALCAALPRIGQIRFARLAFMNYSSKYDDYKAGVIHPSFSADLGGGALADLGVYAVYAALMLFGKPETVWARSTSLSSGADGTTTVVCGYPEFNCVLSVSKQSTAHTPSEIQGEKASLIIGNPFMRSTIELDDGATRTLVARQETDDMLTQLKALFRFLTTPEPAALERAHCFMRGSTALLEQCRACARE
ncbi:MAG: Gfo/Idh/MocA family oxidoreductase [Spirochaetaceae bacterium]|jgi:predicted dehydrogenase|nr:Gfo/Idh/MocA family oxidoreductase [Spirochaetaceae bacterium]